MSRAIQAQYDQIAEYCQTHDVPDHMRQQSLRFPKGEWRTYQKLLARIPDGVAGKVALEFGCKFGHLTPLLVAHGAQQVINVDVEPSYLENGNNLADRDSFAIICLIFINSGNSGPTAARPRMIR